MASAPSLPPAPLPPVNPPSGSMILRLFLVPALIVATLVGLFLVGPWLSDQVGGLFGRQNRNASAFLRDLDSTNPEVRWRAASDLAQVLLRNEELASDPAFALEIVDRLERVVEASAEPEQQFAKVYGGLEAGKKAEWLRKLEPDRNYKMYLGACVGNLLIPVGVPVLKRLALQERGIEPEALSQQRRRALLALTTLGRNLVDRFDALAEEKQDTIETNLAEILGQESTTQVRRELIRRALDHLKKRRQGQLEALGFAEILAECARDNDPSIRLHAAQAAAFWFGNSEEEKQITTDLLQLSFDSGVGEEEEKQLLEKNPDSVRTQEIITRPGFRIQVQATLALARRGSDKTRLELCQQCLDFESLKTICIVRDRTRDTQLPNETFIHNIAMNVLRALVHLHRKNNKVDLTRLHKPIRELANHPNLNVRTEAIKTLKALGIAEE